MSDNNLKSEVAVFGGGCFWCTEAVFKMLKGVISVDPGYSGGTVPSPTYEQVCTGNTGHAECTKVVFDPTLISYKDLLTVFFGSHDPTSVNRQGNDMGTQYRSVIFYTTNSQKNEAENFIAELNTSNINGKKIATGIEPLVVFYIAENYHKDYFAKHGDQAYCELVINPKLEKVQKEFADLIRSHS